MFERGESTVRVEALWNGFLKGACYGKRAGSVIVCKRHVFSDKLM